MGRKEKGLPWELVAISSQEGDVVFSHAAVKGRVEKGNRIIKKKTLWAGSIAKEPKGKKAISQKG